jgi:hypothetical protein
VKEDGRRFVFRRVNAKIIADIFNGRILANALSHRNNGRGSQNEERTEVSPRCRTGDMMTSTLTTLETGKPCAMF